MVDKDLVLEDVLDILTIDDEPTIKILKRLIDVAYSRILTRIGATVFPVELEWILTELCISRYNRLGSEGVHSELNEGIQYIFERSLLDEYEQELKEYVKRNPAEGAGRFRMM